jgi:hypothetical protein
MLLIVNSTDVTELTSAIASNLVADRDTVRGALITSLNLSDPLRDEQSGRIDEEAFRGLLAAAGVAVAATDLILGAAIVAFPQSLQGEDHEEGMLAALAKELGRDRSRFAFDDDDDDADLALSVNFRHEGGNAFDCDVASSEDYDMTVWVHAGQDDRQVRAILSREPEALRDLVWRFDTDWIGCYIDPDDEALVLGRPSFNPDIVVCGVDVQVWPGAVRYTKYDSVGNVIKKKVVAIDQNTFDRIELALYNLNTGWVHNAHAVGIIREIVPLD